MATETHQIVVDARFDEVTEARQRVAELDAQLAQLKEQQARNAVTAGEFASSYARITAELQQARAALQSVASVAQGQAGITSQASAATAAYAKTLKDAGGAAGRGGAAGNILLLSQVVDDAQYGFRAIVNQLPQVGIAAAQTFGLSTETGFKFGGALGLIGVAINQNLKNLDDWRILLDDIGAADTFAPIIDGFKQVGESLNAVLFQASSLLGFPLKFSQEVQAATAKDKAAEAGRQKEAEKAGESVDAILSKAAQDRARAFRAAIEGEAGGGAGVRERLVRDRVAESGLSNQDLDREFKLPGGTATTKRRQMEEAIGLMLGRALQQGDEGAIRDIIGRLPGGDRGSFAQRFEQGLPAYKEGVKEFEAQKKREAEEAAEHNRRIDEAAAKRAEELANNVNPSLELEALAGLPVGRERVKRALTETQGVTGEDAEAIVDAVVEKFQTDLKQAVAKKAGEARISPEDARTELLAARAIELSKKRGVGAMAAQIGLDPQGESALAEAAGGGGPLTRAATFASGVEFSRYAQEAALSGDKDRELKEHSRLLEAIKNNTDPANQRPPVIGPAIARGPVAIDGPG
jgi:hypothetical protein